MPLCRTPAYGQVVTDCSSPVYQLVIVGGQEKEGFKQTSDLEGAFALISLIEALYSSGRGCARRALVC